MYHKKVTLKILEELIGTLHCMGPEYQAAIDKAAELEALLKRLHGPVKLEVKTVSKEVH